METDIIIWRNSNIAKIDFLYLPPFPANNTISASAGPVLVLRGRLWGGPT